MQVTFTYRPLCIILSNLFAAYLSEERFVLELLSSRAILATAKPSC